MWDSDMQVVRHGAVRHSPAGAAQPQHRQRRRRAGAGAARALCGAVPDGYTVGEGLRAQPAQHPGAALSLTAVEFSQLQGSFAGALLMGTLPEKDYLRNLRTIQVLSDMKMSKTFTNHEKRSVVPFLTGTLSERDYLRKLRSIQMLH